MELVLLCPVLEGLVSRRFIKFIFFSIIPVGYKFVASSFFL